MAFLLAEDGRDENAPTAFRRYQAYLASIAGAFPPSAYAQATSGWYFDPRDHRCPHDAWLESLTVTEPSSGDRSEIRRLSLSVRLLGAYHDGSIDLYYPQVFRYRLGIEHGERGHGDWRCDELRVSDERHLIHEIEWRGAHERGTWIIDASDVEYRWTQR